MGTFINKFEFRANLPRPFLVLSASANTPCPEIQHVLRDPRCYGPIMPLSLSFFLFGESFSRSFSTAFMPMRRSTATHLFVPSSAFLLLERSVSGKRRTMCVHCYGRRQPGGRSGGAVGFSASRNAKVLPRKSATRVTSRTLRFGTRPKTRPFADVVRRPPVRSLPPAPVQLLTCNIRAVPACLTGNRRETQKSGRPRTGKACQRTLSVRI